MLVRVQQGAELTGETKIPSFHWVGAKPHFKTSRVRQAHVSGAVYTPSFNMNVCVLCSISVACACYKDE